MLKVAAHAAEDLNEHRNSLVHGYLISFGDGSTPSFMKNPGRHDTNRNRPVGDDYINEPLQDLVLIAARTLFGLVQQMEKPLKDPDAQAAIEATYLRIEDDRRHDDTSAAHQARWRSRCGAGAAGAPDPSARIERW